MGKTIHSPEYERLLARLRELREAAGLRQVDLAGQLGRPQSFVSKYETGERRLDLIELRDICRVLGGTVAELSAYLEEEWPGR